MKTWKSRREGFALAAAVLAMMVVGAVVTGGFYAASQHGQIAKSSDAADLALYIAETGMNNTMATVTGNALSAIALNGTQSQTQTSVAYGGRTVGHYQTWISRVTPVMYVVRSVGTVTLQGPYSGATRTVSTVVRVRQIDMDNNTALQIYGNFTATGNTNISSTDFVDTNWSGCTPSTASSILSNPTSVVVNAGSGTIQEPQSQQAMDEADFTEFGDLDFEALAGLANYRYSTGYGTVQPQPIEIGSGAGATCDFGDVRNWGAPESPSSPCYTHFPIMEAQGDLTVNSNSVGQGILLVRGNLVIAGGFEFYGAIVVLGTLTMGSGAGEVNGTLIAYGGGNPLITNTTLGNSRLRYSSCAISRAVNGNARLAKGTPIANRAWIDVSNVQNQ